MLDIRTMTLHNRNGFHVPKRYIPTVSKVLIPKSIPTELSVLGNTQSKTSTTKLRKYRLAESLITFTDDGIGVSSFDHTIFTCPILVKQTIS